MKASLRVTTPLGIVNENTGTFQACVDLDVAPTDTDVMVSVVTDNTTATGLF